MNCEVGDIVLVSNFRYPDGSDGSLLSNEIQSANSSAVLLYCLAVPSLIAA